jgi:uncharacterized protein YhaN
LLPSIRHGRKHIERLASAIERFARRQKSEALFRPKLYASRIVGSFWWRIATAREFGFRGSEWRGRAYRQGPRRWRSQRDVGIACRLHREIGDSADHDAEGDKEDILRLDSMLSLHVSRPQ